MVSIRSDTFLTMPTMTSFCVQLAFASPCGIPVGVAGIALAALFAVRQGVWWTMLQETDDILAEDVREIELGTSRAADRAAFCNSPMNSAARRWATKSTIGLWCLSAANGTVIWQSEQPPVEFASIWNSSVAVRKSIADVRLLLQPVGENVHHVAKIFVGASISHIREDMARIDRLVGDCGHCDLAPLAGVRLPARRPRH